MEDLLEILVVEDDRTDCLAVRRALQSANLAANILEADNCAAAIAALTRQTFDCAFLDFTLPDGDGLSVLKQIREGAFRTPIVMMTGHGDERLALDLIEAGAFDCLSKASLLSDSLPQALRNVMWLAQAQKRTRLAEQAHQESEVRFRIMADQTPVLIWMSGTDALGNYFNQRWLDFTGRTLEQEMGNGWTESIHPDDFDGCLEIYLAEFKARKNFRLEYRLRRADGEYRWMLDIGTPRFSPDGAFAGYIGSCLDITDRKQAEDALARNQETISALNIRLRQALMETQDRVKNNLQIITALLDVQRMLHGADLSTEHLKQLETYIYLLALVHELMTQARTPQGAPQLISIPVLLERLLPTLQSVIGKRTFEFEADEASLTPMQATALAIIVQELICETATHDPHGIRLKFKTIGQTGALEICDDGHGFPLGSALTDVPTLELVETLCRVDLRGSLQFAPRTTDGAYAIVTFPLEPNQ